MVPLGAIFGGPIGGWIAQQWGRKCSLMFSGVPYVVGYLLLSYSHYASSIEVFRTLILLGRFSSGLGAGWGSAVTAVSLLITSPKFHQTLMLSFRFILASHAQFSERDCRSCDAGHVHLRNCFQFGSRSYRPLPLLPHLTGGSWDCGSV